MSEGPAPRRYQPKGGLVPLRVTTRQELMHALWREAKRRNVTVSLVVTECLRTCLDVEANHVDP